MRKISQLALFLLLASSCRSTLYSQTGKIVGGYAVDHMMPYLLGSDDADFACSTGTGLGGFALSFERVTDPPNRAALSVMAAAALCSEAGAREKELDYLLAIQQGKSAAAEDARIAEKRLRARAARRYHASWNRLVQAYGDPTVSCPEFESESDKSIFLLGLFSGVEAVLNDRAAEGDAQVPLDLPRLAAKAAECLTDQAFWGVPSALKAAVWTSVPGATPAGSDPWAVLEAAAVAGDATGVRLARAMQIESLNGAGRQDDVKRALAALAKSEAAVPSAAPFRLLDANAHLIALHMSDRIWVTQTGHRTPMGSLGTFPGGAAAHEDSGLLDDLGGAPPAAPAAAPATPPVAPARKPAPKGKK